VARVPAIVEDLRVRSRGRHPEGMGDGGLSVSD
jgi:hypothetical protein